MTCHLSRYEHFCSLFKIKRMSLKGTWMVVVLNEDVNITPKITVDVWVCGNGQ